MDDLKKNCSNRMYQGWPNRGSRAFWKILFLFLHIAKCRNIVKWYCCQRRIYA